MTAWMSSSISPVSSHPAPSSSSRSRPRVIIDLSSDDDDDNTPSDNDRSNGADTDSSDESSDNHDDTTLQSDGLRRLPPIDILAFQAQQPLAPSTSRADPPPGAFKSAPDRPKQQQPAPSLAPARRTRSRPLVRASNGSSPMATTLGAAAPSFKALVPVQFAPLPATAHFSSDSLATLTRIRHEHGSPCCKPFSLVYLSLNREQGQERDLATMRFRYKKERAWDDMLLHSSQPTAQGTASFSSPMLPVQLTTGNERMAFDALDHDNDSEADTDEMESMESWVHELLVNGAKRRHRANSIWPTMVVASYSVLDVATALAQQTQGLVDAFGDASLLNDPGDRSIVEKSASMADVRYTLCYLPIDEQLYLRYLSTTYGSDSPQARMYRQREQPQCSEAKAINIGCGGTVGFLSFIRQLALADLFAQLPKLKSSSSTRPADCLFVHNVPHVDIQLLQGRGLLPHAKRKNILLQCAMLQAQQITTTWEPLYLPTATQRSNLPTPALCTSRNGEGMRISLQHIRIGSDLISVHDPVWVTRPVSAALYNIYSANASSYPLQPLLGEFGLLMYAAEDEGNERCTYTPPHHRGTRSGGGAGAKPLKHARPEHQIAAYVKRSTRRAELASLELHYRTPLDNKPRMMLELSMATSSSPAAAVVAAAAATVTPALGNGDAGQSGGDEATATFGSHDGPARTFTTSARLEDVRLSRYPPAMHVQPGVACARENCIQFVDIL
ncbi:hypothetical protein RI367_004874 [Sorochytrium milnesiophthora]